jgi:ATP-binding cassette subfamily A (ABC1) protein 3
VPLTNASIDVTLQPLPFSNLQRSLLDTLSNFFAVLFIVIAFSFIPASFAVYVVKEREVSAKHQQLISGVSIPAYWAATYAWDCANYAVPALGAFFLLLGFNQLVRRQQQVSSHGAGWKSSRR